jgi:hypothetical protein
MKLSLALFALFALVAAVTASTEGNSALEKVLAAHMTHVKTISNVVRNDDLEKRALLEEGGLLESLTSGLGSVVDLVKNAKDIFHTESHSKFKGDRNPGNGFSLLELNTDSSHGVIEQGMLREYLDFTFNRSPMFKGLSKQRMDALRYSFEELLYFSSDEDKGTTRFDVNFKDSNGKLTFVSLTFKARAKDSNYVVYRSYLKANFALEKDYFIVSKAKASFFSSKSSEEIVYVNRGVTQKDIKDILDIAFMPSRLLLEFENPNLIAVDGRPDGAYD